MLYIVSPGPTTWVMLHPLLSGAADIGMAATSNTNNRVAITARNHFLLIPHLLIAM
jgi:hypothetical protein